MGKSVFTVWALRWISRLRSRWQAIKRLAIPLFVISTGENLWFLEWRNLFFFSALCLSSWEFNFPFRLSEWNGAHGEICVFLFWRCAGSLGYARDWHWVGGCLFLRLSSLMTYPHFCKKWMEGQISLCFKSLICQIAIERSVTESKDLLRGLLFFCEV